MARSSGKFRRRKRSEPRRRNICSSERKTMLNLGRITTFKYGMREIMSHHKVDEAVASSVIAGVIAKGSRISIASARSYVHGQEKAGVYSKEISDEICDLLDRYSTYR